MSAPVDAWKVGTDDVELHVDARGVPKLLARNKGAGPWVEIPADFAFAAVAQRLLALRGPTVEVAHG